MLDVPYSQLATDLASNTLPAFSFITPNEINNMHDGTIADGDNWLAANLPAIFNSPEYQDGSTAVFVTWDEGEGGKATQCATNTTDVGCHIATIVISPSTQPGTTSGTLFNHYSLLGTAEQLLGLPKLGLASHLPHPHLSLQPLAEHRDNAAAWHQQGARRSLQVQHPVGRLTAALPVRQPAHPLLREPFPPPKHHPDVHVQAGGDHRVLQPICG
jgi:hypothetical protein